MCSKTPCYPQYIAVIRCFRPQLSTPVASSLTTKAARATVNVGFRLDARAHTGAQRWRMVPRTTLSVRGSNGNVDRPILNGDLKPQPPPRLYAESALLRRHWGSLWEGSKVHRPASQETSRAPGHLAPDNKNGRGVPWGYWQKHLSTPLHEIPPLLRS
jgi:hypothetical protein